MLEAIVKASLSLLFLMCLLHMPYGYYQAVRFIAMLGFILLAYFSNKQNHKIEAITYIALALLFQPFIKVALGRTVWNILDVIVSAGLIISLFVNAKKITH